MRWPVREDWVGAQVGDDLRLRRVDSKMFRDFWFKATKPGGVHTLTGYATKEDAEAGTSPVVVGTFNPVASGDVTVTMAASPGALFNPLPMEVRLFAPTSGNWTSATLGWSGAVETVAINRIQTILKNYIAAYEALDTVAEVVKGHSLPDEYLGAGSPVVGVTHGLSSADTEVGPNLWKGLVDVEVVAWALEADKQDSMDLVSRLAGALRSICLDEQRTWFGFATDTRLRGGITIQEQQEGNSWLHRAVLPLTLVLAEAQGQREVGGQVSTGGKYTAGL